MPNIRRYFETETVSKGFLSDTGTSVKYSTREIPFKREIST